MNNKILARVVAVVMAVAMLGTVSFAADIIADYDEIGAINANATNTVLAYVADAEDEAVTDKNIVAVVQETGEITSIPFDDSKLTGKNYLIVKNGGLTSAGAAAAVNTVTIPLTSQGGVTVASIEVHDTLVVGETTYKDALVVTWNIENTEGKTARAGKWGVKFGKFTGDATDMETISKGLIVDFPGATDITGDAGSKTKFTAAIIGVPKDVTGVSARTYIEWE